jgi:dTDP-4-dehydrorhamnose reductase
MKPHILIAGGSGLLGVNWAVQTRHLFRPILALHQREILISGVEICHIEFNSIHDITRQICESKPQIVINAAGLTNVDQCEKTPDLSKAINVDLAKNIASACNQLGVKMVQISTDHLFSGEMPMLDEQAPVNPLNVYGKSKAEAEKQILNVNSSALVIRTNFFGWGPSYRSSFSDFIIDTLVSKNKLTLFDDVFFTPIHTSTLIRIVHELVACDAKGIFNVVGDERISKKNFGQKIIKKFNLDAELVNTRSIKDEPLLAHRPADMSLSNHKLRRLLRKDIGDVDYQINRLHDELLNGLTSEIKNL